tara:strand:+ start:613 stop:894 length:282 start_codon:yes stop_codon:yes gene_type:complete
MDEEDIQDELIKINSIHQSLDDSNPTTYLLFLEENKDKLNDDQIIWINNKIKKLVEKQRKRNKKILDYVDNELSRQPAETKYNDKENYFKQIN